MPVLFHRQTKLFPPCFAHAELISFLAQQFVFMALMSENPDELDKLHDFAKEADTLFLPLTDENGMIEYHFENFFLPLTFLLQKYAAVLDVEAVVQNLRRK